MLDISGTFRSTGETGSLAFFPVTLTGDRGFESGPLQRGVSCETDFLAASQVRTFARANERALKPGTWPVWLGEAPTDVAQLEVLLALPFRKMIC